MKKLYTLLLGVAVAVSASALTPNRAFTKAEIAKNLKAQSVELVKTNIQSNLKLQKNSELAATMKAAQKEEAAKQQAAAKIPESWEDAGTVMYADAFFLPMLYTAEMGIDVQTFVETCAWEVPVMKSARNESRFKLVDPYHQESFKALWDQIGINQVLGAYDTFFTSDAFDIVIDASNPDFVTMDLQQLFKFTDEAAADMDAPGIWGWPVSGYFLNAGNAASAITANGYASTFKNGIITLKRCVFGISNNKDEAAYNWTGAPQVDGVITFADAKDVKFNYQAASSCSNNMKHTFSVNLGADMASAKYLLLPLEISDASDNILNAVESNFGELLVDIAETNGNAIDAEFAEAIGYGDGPATLFLIGYDADGTRVNGEVHPLFFSFDEPEKWESLGEVDYTDDIVAPAWRFEGENGGNVETYKVVLEENIETKGLYRLVNPYNAEGWKYANRNMHEVNGCKHFLVIDASNPDAVEIPACYPGFGLNGFGHLMVASINNAIETPDASYSGKLENGVITFPAGAIIEGYSQDYNENDQIDYFQCNFTGKFKVDLTTSGISDVTIGVNENAPVEYFNLQGVRVANPAAGELVIKRQGDKVSKTVIR